MSTSVTKAGEATAAEVWFDGDILDVRLLDGREISVRVEWSPSLRSASEEQRKKWRLIGKGVGIHREDIDEDTAVASLLLG